MLRATKPHKAGASLSMSTLAFGLILFSALTHAIYNALIKSARDKLVARMLMAVFSSLYLLPFAAFVPLPSPHMFALLAFTAFVHFGYQMAQVKSLQHADYTLAYPVSRGSAPLLVAGLAPLVLGDSASAVQLSGVAVISVSILSMAFEGRGGNGRGLIFAVLTGVMIAAYTLIDARGVRMGETAATFIIWFFLFDSVVISTYTLSSYRRRFGAVARYEWPLAALNGLLGILTFGAALYAFRIGNAAVLSALRETSVIFAALIGWLFLGEHVGAVRWVAILGIATGVALVRLG